LRSPTCACSDVLADDGDNVFEFFLALFVAGFVAVSDGCDDCDATFALIGVNARRKAEVLPLFPFPV